MGLATRLRRLDDLVAGAPGRQGPAWQMALPVLLPGSAGLSALVAGLDLGNPGLAVGGGVLTAGWLGVFGWAAWAAFTGRGTTPRAGAAWLAGLGFGLAFVNGAAIVTTDRLHDVPTTVPRLALAAAGVAMGVLGLLRRRALARAGDGSAQTT